MITNNIQIAIIGPGACTTILADALLAEGFVIEVKESSIITKPEPINFVLQKSPEKLIVEKRPKKNWQRRQY